MEPGASTDRGRYGPSVFRGPSDNRQVTVGQALFHTAADRARAISALSTHFRALASDLAAWLRANPGAPASVTSAQWFEADVTPMLEEWRDFVVQQRGSWWNQMATSWETYEE